MSVVEKSPDMIALENCFKELKTKTNVTQNLQQIERIIKRNFDIDFTISIVNNTRGKFFGMTIYPQINYIEAMVANILESKSRMDTIVQLWNTNKKWTLEIDSILLYDTNLNANPAEIVAVLLHEIGHVIYSNTVPQRVYRIMKYEIMNLSISMRKLIQWKRVQRLFDLAFIEACSSKNFRFINLHTERVADKFVVKMGYGETLDNFIGKLIAAQGNSLVNRTEEDMDHDVRSIVNWGIDNITELEFRKKKLRSSLHAELLRNPSQYVKDAITRIRNTFFGPEEDTYKSVVSEQYLVNHATKIVQEGLLDIFDKYGKVKKITQNDIDILTVEAGRIENEDDKIYVLDLIYDKLEIINTSLQLIAENKKDKVPTPKETLLSFKNQLEKLRKEVLSLTIKEKTYGVFIKYPKGYEG